MDGNYVTFRCPAELRAQLEAAAAEDDRSLSYEIRRACQMYLKNRYRPVVGTDGKLSYIRATE